MTIHVLLVRSRSYSLCTYYVFVLNWYMVLCCFMWLLFISFFFFRQKPAYEMLIGDWSSDVCSSDLAASIAYQSLHFALVVALAGPPDAIGEEVVGLQLAEDLGAPACPIPQDAGHGQPGIVVKNRARNAAEEGEGRYMAIAEGLAGLRRIGLERSEEHTSELQSLMRISYAVFCLKKKKQKTTNTNTNHTKSKNTTYTNKE